MIQHAASKPLPQPIKVIGAVLMVAQAALAVALGVLPAGRWSRDGETYLNLHTLGSWLFVLQLVAIAVLGIVALLQDRGALRRGMWLVTAGAAVGLGFMESTRVRTRTDLLDLAQPDVYGRMILLSVAVLTLSCLGWFVLVRLSARRTAVGLGICWLAAWALHYITVVFYMPESLVIDRVVPYLAALGTFARLAGCTCLALALTAYVMNRRAEAVAPVPENQSTAALLPEGKSRAWTFLGVAAMTFTIIFVQILLLRLLNIFGDYMIGISVISVALLGITVGGMIGAVSAHRAPIASMIGAALLLPVTIVLALGTTVQLTERNPLLTSLLLMTPFVCPSVVITVVLARARSHLVYCIDLVGAGIGSLLVGTALRLFREEGSMLLLAAFTSLSALCFIRLCPRRGARRLLAAVAVLAAAALASCGWANLRGDYLNVVRTVVGHSYRHLTMVHSRSSFVGRYDVIKRRPHHRAYATFDNGRIIDNIRQWPSDYYRIDPRVPHTLMDDASILILGLSGDGISKTAKSLCREVYGVEINPVIVELQSNELAEFNRHSYRGIDVAVMDGRSYVDQAERSFDSITMMNAHSMRGRTSGRAASPEYLHTVEAMESYLDRLTDRGFVNIEEAASFLRREIPVWKLMVTMRQALINRGSPHPDQHFFVFQWKTRSSNYIQILMKKTPWTAPELAKLRQWLDDVNNRSALEDQAGRRLGPITCTCTILYAPDERLETNYDRILRGRAPQEFLQAHLLRPTTDDRPYHFDVEPHRPEFTTAYQRTVIMVVLLSPFLLWFLWRYRGELGMALPYGLIVALTGLGYLLIEVVFIQRFEIFLGSPVVTFSTVLGTMLMFSGLGSLWSGGIGQRGVYGALVAVLLLLAVQEWLVPPLLTFAATWSLAARVALSAATIAPLAFAMGVPFPYALRTGKARFSDSAAAVFFAINAAASALAVPLSVNISAAYGFAAVFEIGMGVYAFVGLLLVALYRPKMIGLAVVGSLAAAAILLLSPWLMNRPADINPIGSALYRVYAANCGRGSLLQKDVFADGRATQRESVTFSSYIARSSERTVLLGTGPGGVPSDPQVRVRRLVNTTEHLQSLDLQPSEVSDIVVTSLRWNQIGDLVAYPRATLWIQRAAYEFAKSTVDANRQRAANIRWPDVQQLIRAEEEGRLRLLEGEQVILPGITVVPSATEHPGSQFASIATLLGPVVVAGDGCYLYENSSRQRPVGAALDPQENLASIREMQRRAASTFMVLPAYDPEIFRAFPNIAPGLVEINGLDP